MLSYVMFVGNWHENSIFQTVQVCHKSLVSLCYFFCTVIILLFAICHSLVNVNIFCNTSFTTTVVLGQISTGHMDLFFQQDVTIFVPASGGKIN